MFGINLGLNLKNISSDHIQLFLLNRALGFPGPPLKQLMNLLRNARKVRLNLHT
jgi:hypothetical protein